MCGIAGRAGPHPNWPSARAVRALQHRGPDASGADEAEVDGWWCSIAHTRLAINDLTPAGDQPIYNEDRSLALVFNGEIYNSPALRRLCEARGHQLRSQSDGEVIVHLWEDEGIAALIRLNGIFALVLHDRRDGSVTLARDPIGVKPLFWSAEGETVWFASELGALQEAGGPVGSPDVVALGQFLTFLWIPDPRTPFENASSLPPGTAMTWRRGRIDTTRYCDLVGESANDDEVSLATAQHEFGGRFQEAVQRQLLSDVPLALMASGGIDSSLIWWAVKGSFDLAYTIDWSGEHGDEGLHEDTEAVRLLEQSFGTPVTCVPGQSVDLEALPASGDLFADPAVELCRQIAERAHGDGHKVLFSGQGGDELLGGYRRHLLGPPAARVRTGRAGRTAATTIRRLRPGALSAEYASRFALATSKADPLSSYMVLCSYSDPLERAKALDVDVAEVTDDVVWQVHRSMFDRTPDEWSLLRRFRALDLEVYLPGLGLAYADRSGMRHSVEVRVPWLDLELVRWCMRLPDAALVNGRSGKRLSRELSSRVLPPLITTRPKRGFAAPARLMPKATAASSRGFRQGQYLAAATAMTRQWLVSA